MLTGKSASGLHESLSRGSWDFCLLEVMKSRRVTPKQESRCYIIVAKGKGEGQSVAKMHEPELNDPR